MTGRFVVLEGGDGVGTTTQCQRLREALEARGHDVVTTAQPSKGPAGALARKVLQGQTPSADGWRALALLFAADRLAHVEEEIVPALDRGAFVICDRYVLSSLVYQGLNAPLDWVRSINRFARAADVTLIVDLDVEEARRRLLARGDPTEIYDALETQAEIRARYRELAVHVDGRIIDGSGSVDDVTARLLEAIGA